MRIYVQQETKYESCFEQLIEEYLEVDNINSTIPWQKIYKKMKALQTENICH